RARRSANPATDNSVPGVRQPGPERPQGGVMRGHVSTVGGLVLAVVVCGLRASAGPGEGLAARLRGLEAGVAASDAAAADVRARLQAANRRETAAWRALKTREDWERYRDARLKALRDSLGAFPPPPKDLKVHVTRTLAGE